MERPVLRPATADDEPFLRRMTYEAAVRPDRPGEPFDQVLANPRNARFVDGWGRPGDLGVVAEDDGEPVGAAWLRMHAGEEFAPGYRGDPVAQLAIALVVPYRGRGWGRELLEHLLDEAERRGVHEIQLTVGVANVAAVRLYETMGFSVLVTDGRSARMAWRA